MSGADAKESTAVWRQITYFEFCKHPQYSSILLEVCPFRLIWQAGDLGEGLERVAFREEREDVLHIQSAVGIEEPLHGLQLGSSSVDVGHPGYDAGVTLVGLQEARYRGHFKDPLFISGRHTQARVPPHSTINACELMQLFTC